MECFRNTIIRTNAMGWVWLHTTNNKCRFSYQGWNNPKLLIQFHWQGKKIVTNSPIREKKVRNYFIITHDKWKMLSNFLLINVQGGCNLPFRAFEKKTPTFVMWITEKWNQKMNSVDMERGFLHIFYRILFIFRKCCLRSHSNTPQSNHRYTINIRILYAYINWVNDWINLY